MSVLHEGFFDNTYYRFWCAEEKTSAIANVFAIHGLGGHCLWFDNAASYFNKRNINFFSFDLPGFGQSKYPKGTVASYKEWISVTRDVLKKFLVSFQLIAPVFILGHSMGALIAILLNKSVRANGWIFSVPGFEGNKQCFPFSSFVLPVLCKALIGSKENVVVPFGPELLTKNRGTQLKLKSDPYRIINLDASVYKHVHFLALRAKLYSKLLTDPVLMLIAGGDVICSNNAMEKFFNEIKVKDKSKKVYTNAFHDLFVEDELEQVVDDITKWIKVHV